MKEGLLTEKVKQTPNSKTAERFNLFTESFNKKTATPQEEQIYLRNSNLAKSEVYFVSSVAFK